MWWQSARKHRFHMVLVFHNHPCTAWNQYLWAHQSWQSLEHVEHVVCSITSRFISRKQLEIFAVMYEPRGSGVMSVSPLGSNMPSQYHLKNLIEFYTLQSDCSAIWKVWFVQNSSLCNHSGATDPLHPLIWRLCLGVEPVPCCKNQEISAE